MQAFHIIHVANDAESLQHMNKSGSLLGNAHT